MADEGAAHSQMLQVYPNPGHNELNVQFNAAVDDNYLLQLLDLTGRIIITNKGKGTGDQMKQILDVSEFARGSYMLQLVTNKGTSQTNIVLQ